MNESESGFGVEADFNPVFQDSDMNPFTAGANPRLERTPYGTDTFVMMSSTSTALKKKPEPNPRENISQQNALNCFCFFFLLHVM